jgi:hypothetical protein
MNTKSFLLSALTAGAIIAVLSNFPALNLLNCFLCVFVWLGGFLAVLFYGKFQKEAPALTPGQGAGLGAVTGVFGALIGFLVNLILSPLTTPIMRAVADAVGIGDVLPADTGGFAAAMVGGLRFLVIDIFAYPLFGALAGLITASAMKKK